MKDIANILNEPIPSMKEVNWEEIQKQKIEECGERLVPASLNPQNILIWPQYYLQGLKGALSECYLREGVFKALVRVARRLPAGFKLVIFDGWRPNEVQISIFEKYKEELKEKLPGIREEELVRKTKQFVALPSTDPAKPSPHSTGASVDLSIVNEQGLLLEMGTEFDETTERTKTRYFEEKLQQGEVLSKKEEEILKNRRLLFHLMDLEGFTNYPEEWWHFDYKNQSWAWMKGEGLTARYGKAEPFFRWK